MSPNKDDRNETDASRRALLKGVAAGSVAAAGLSGTAAATEAVGRASLAEKEAVSARYDTERAVREAVADHAGDFLAALADEGYLDTADPADLVTEPRSTDEHLASDRSVAVGAVPADDGLTAHVELAYRTDDHDLSVLVQPEAGRAYAHLDDGETVQRLDYDPEDGVSVEDTCIVTTVCDNQLCDSTAGNYKVYEVECCEQAGCSVGPVVDCCIDFPGYVDPCCEACGC
jgi:hypothetical protein